MRSTVAVFAVLTLSVTSASAQTAIGTAGAATATQAPAPPPGAINPNGPTNTAKPMAVAQPAPKPEPKPVVPVGVELPQGYVIGLQDVLDVSVWKEKDMSSEGVVVRPDGKISLPLVNDVDALGLTVDQLRSAITEKAAKFVQEPEVSVVVKQINSRRVSITGQVAKPGQYPLLTHMTVVDMISAAGGAAEYAKTKEIRITRKQNGKSESLVFNYKDFLKGKPKAIEQNIELMPGDIVTVP